MLILNKPYISAVTYTDANAYKSSDQMVAIRMFQSNPTEAQSMLAPKDSWELELNQNKAHFSHFSVCNY